MLNRTGPTASPKNSKGVRGTVLTAWQAYATRASSAGRQIQEARRKALLRMYRNHARGDREGTGGDSGIDVHSNTNAFMVQGADDDTQTQAYRDRRILQHAPLAYLAAQDACRVSYSSPLPEHLVLLVALVESVDAHHEISKGQEDEAPIKTDGRPSAALFFSSRPAKAGQA